ncbi:unnamed protein product [Notodromas monacha]|uniref:Uncharacterized protein n=1 Tax=Notodromas monacha TaxID=399045 RepID=A0A7R9BX18_9CRUS|nr:unnamed protein product [Notodromas monacha]CAG0923367.1 unnamed protein product [Notodromas monacha]
MTLPYTNGQGGNSGSETIDKFHEAFTWIFPVDDHFMDPLVMLQVWDNVEALKGRKNGLYHETGDRWEVLRATTSSTN